ncbi:MAG: aldehyde ferredoxin oxidoreductase [Thermoprotei archaeon]|nr:MAG: aldehyde ferredoxin oxidoreductase [Thermoprotei archaeon]
MSVEARGGWWGRALRVDLSSKEVYVEELKLDFLRKFVGGSGFGVKWLYELTKPRMDPLSPENWLIMAAGPLTGSRVYGASRITITSKSPLTGTVFDSTCGGFFPLFFKRAGFDALLIHGSSEEPVYIHVYDDGADVLSARDLWGLKVSEVIRELRSRHGFKCSAIAIGPAGENLVKIASIMGDNGHASGRGGLGAVMGSKKLKAVVASGTKRVEEAHPEKLDQLLENMNVRITWNPYLGGALKNLGTSALLTVINDWGLLPTMNFSKSIFEGAERISAEELNSKLTVGRRGCYNCPIVCKRATRTAKASGDGPEYESVVNLGSMLMVDDLEGLAEMNYLCNELGLDTISMGGTLACLLELIEMEAVRADVKWGEVDKLKKLIIDTAYRRGLGGDLAEGSKRLATKHGVPEVSVTVKGLEVPAYDPRGAYGMALSYGTSYRGACHLRSWTIAFEVIGVPNLVDRFSFYEKPALVKYTQDLAALYDCLVMCKHFAVEFDEEPISLLVNAVTGVQFSKEELLMVGERVWNLARMFNLREGFTWRDDLLPPRLLRPLTEGPIAGRVPPYHDMLKAYYEVRGWSDEGKPTQETLSRLGLSGGVHG